MLITFQKKAREGFTCFQTQEFFAQTAIAKDTPYEVSFAFQRN